MKKILILLAVVITGPCLQAPVSKAFPALHLIQEAV